MIRSVVAALALAAGFLALIVPPGEAALATFKDGSTPRPAWTVAKAKAALLAARRIEAQDDISRNYRFSYYFQVLKPEVVRPVGKSYAVSAQIGLLQDLPDEWYGGAFDETPTRAWFCLRPAGKTWRLTGFDVRLPFFGGSKVPNAVCAPSAKRMARSGGPL